MTTQLQLINIIIIIIIIIYCVYSPYIKIELCFATSMVYCNRCSKIGVYFACQMITN